MFERIKRFYDRNLWTKQQVHAVTGWGYITPDQYEEITGEKYSA